MSPDPTFPMKRLLGVVFILNFIEFLQAGMIVFAAVPIMGQISASPEEYSFVSALYASVAVASISLTQVLRRYLGWKRYLFLGLAIFVGGALICALSGDLGGFALGRAVMAAGGGAFMTSARMLINVIPPSPQRVKGIAAFGSALALGMASAPWTVATAIGHDVWHAAFFLLIGLAIIATFLVAALPLQEQLAPDGHGIDWTPVATILASTFCMLYGIQRMPYDYHANPLSLFVWFLVGLPGVVYFIYTQANARGKNGLLNVRGLLNLRYGIGLTIFSISYVVLGANNYMFPIYLQRGLGVSWATAGQVQTLGLISSLVAFLSLLYIVKSWPAAKKFYVAAFALLCVFGWRMSNLNGEANVWTDVVPALACFGAFVTLGMATTALHAFRDLQDDEQIFFNGQQVKNMLSQLGLAIGVTSASLGSQARIAQHYSVLGEKYIQGGVQFGTKLDQLTSILGSTQAALGQIAQEVTQQTILMTSMEYFWSLSWLALVCLVLLCLQHVVD